MFPMNRKAVRELPVTVEYDCREKRTTKTLPNSLAARSFYVAKHKQGKNPKVIKDRQNDQD